MSNFNMQNENPSFFKILSASDFASVLRLPPLFGKIFGEKLSSTPSLAMAGSWKSWTVKLKKSSNRYLFADGWSVFVNDNQLEIGNFVVFWLMDNYSTFHVQLYDRTCCDKSLSSSRFFPGFSGENSSNLGQTMSVKKESETEDDKSQISIGPSKTTTNPSFVTILSASTDEEMIIPKGFVEETGIAGKRNITLLDARGEKWEIKISKQDGEFVMCGGRWADFRIANRLSKGYVCTFELVGSHGGHHQLQFHLEKRARGRPLGRHSRQ
ncbi:PREDICTED: B3 domain-containing protein REM5-like isoform X1 [Ipomoea nil]|uniref:B3 domain-containing protein REM5-like isoform X1 n=1 Tax=Ipomoea nil TaxID=35883 RepID=UPI0009019062|nr:PREDICTED: B3 domain-containing protein REM5-like isoform X1 [Ipomoea nil]